jgi:hypothetical protein
MADESAVTGAPEAAPPGAPTAPTGPADAAVSRDPGTPDQAPDDANDMRGYFFRKRLHKQSTYIWGGILSLALGAGGAFISPALIPVGIVVGVLVTLLVVFFMADSESEKAFFQHYAEERGMTYAESGGLPAATPLLRKGDERRAKDLLSGPLAEGLDGTLAMYTYTEVYYDKNGRHETDYNFTVALCELPATQQFMPVLYGNRKAGFRFLEKVEDAFRTKERVKLESEKLDQEYEIFCNKGQDQNWLRQLFSPTFIVWLTDQAPDKFAFELEDGVLCCNIKGHKESAAGLDSMAAAAGHIAERMSEEMKESAPAAPGQQAADAGPPQGA